MGVCPIAYSQFKRVFERNFRIGVYPEIEFYIGDTEYCIAANLTTFFLYELTKESICGLESTEEYKELSSSKTLDELVANASINGRKLENMWDEIEFHDYEENFKYQFAYRDAVRIKSKDVYGVVTKIEEDNGKVRCVVDCHDGLMKAPVDWKQEDMITCNESDLEYDEREETIKFISEGYASYLERLTT